LRATFIIASAVDGFGEMIMLKDYPPYQKIDFSLGDSGKKFWPFLIVYDNQDKSKISQTKLNSIHIKQDVAYKLTEVLFSVPRFTKCLFREDIDMYRRWKSITDIMFVLLYEKHFGWQAETVKDKLGVYEFKCLYEALDLAEKKQLQGVYPSDAQLDLARSYQASINLFIALSQQKAEYLGVELDSAFIDYIKDFMNVEIRRFEAQITLGPEN
jgi:hypothetical protein